MVSTRDIWRASRYQVRGSTARCRLPPLNGVGDGAESATACSALDLVSTTRVTSSCCCLASDSLRDHGAWSTVLPSRCVRVRVVG